MTWARPEFKLSRSLDSPNHVEVLSGHHCAAFGEKYNANRWWARRSHCITVFVKLLQSWHANFTLNFSIFDPPHFFVSNHCCIRAEIRGCHSALLPICPSGDLLYSNEKVSCWPHSIFFIDHHYKRNSQLPTSLIITPCFGIFQLFRFHISEKGIPRFQGV